MSYSEEPSNTFYYFSSDDRNTFYYFSSDDRKVIEGFLKKKKYKWGTNTVCGNCCGMYADQYWIGGIGGKLKKEHRAEFAKLLKEKKIECSFDSSYHLSADPNEYDTCQIKN